MTGDYADGGTLTLCEQDRHSLEVDSAIRPERDPPSSQL